MIYSKIFFLLFLFPITSTAQTNSLEVKIDTLYYLFQQAMVKTPCFVVKYYKLKERQVWKREVYSIGGDLLAKGIIKLTRRKFKQPTPHNFDLIRKWRYYDSKGKLIKERNYGESMKHPETITIEISPNIYYTIW